MGNIVNYAFLAFLGVIVCVVLYRLVRYRSLAGARFGAATVALGEVAAADSFHMPVRVRVHSLESAVPYRGVGLEFVAKALGHIRVMPVTLSNAQALQLAKLLSEAAGERPGNSLRESD
ncbi:MULTISPECIES: hypothetical protein [Lysobacteraceae]|uniref:hypothetical protein n=1 Tax=Lysobacteraceae TaxID=32033 RepID=UPI001BD00881|nr:MULTISPECIES: hypothetical protein [Lysobacter]